MHQLFQKKKIASLVFKRALDMYNAVNFITLHPILTALSGYKIGC